MFASLRSFLNRFQNPTPAPQSRRMLFLKQQNLATDLRRLMRAYERRLDYLQTHLLKLSDTRLQEDQPLFEEAHHELSRLTTRLRAADQDAETLLREWRDWLDHHDPQTLSKEARERLEILRSELLVRGLLPTDRVRGSQAPVAAEKKARRSTYQPVTLSNDPLAIFDRVYAARLDQEKVWLERHWKKASTHGAHLPWKLWLTKRYKRLHGWRKELSKIIS